MRRLIEKLFRSAPVRQEKALPAEWRRPEDDSPADMPTDQLRYMHDEGKCPYCRSAYGLLPGPRGGASVNVFCGNPDCDSRFNLVDPKYGFVPVGQFMGRCPPDLISSRRKAIGGSH